MLDILLVEDNPDKANAIKLFLEFLPLAVKCNLSISVDYVSAKEKLKANQYDLLILDLQIPRSFGDQPNKDGGKDLLTELHKREEKFKRPFNIIGLTSYKESILENKIFFDEHLAFILEFNDSSWKKPLEDKVLYIEASKVGNIFSFKSGLSFDVAIVTALKNPELEMVKRLPLEWVPFKVDNDPVSYFKSSIEVEGRKLNLICASATEMGMSASASLTTKIKALFQPKLIMMAGICAGVEGKANLGDLLVADPAFDYNFGKIIELDGKEKEFIADIRQLRIDERVVNELSELNDDKIFLTTLKEKFMGKKPAFSPAILIGPVGSGSSVIASSKFVNDIALSGSRKLIGIEMESYGVYFAAQKTLTPTGSVVSIKAVCDYANKEKSDDFQDYCAYMSANICLEYIKRYFSKW